MTPNNVKRKDGILGTGRKRFVMAVEAVGMVKSSVLSWRLNVDKDVADLRQNSRLFQVIAAATQKSFIMYHTSLNY